VRLVWSVLGLFGSWNKTSVIQGVWGQKPGNMRLGTTCCTSEPHASLAARSLVICSNLEHSVVILPYKCASLCRKPGSKTIIHVLWAHCRKIAVCQCDLSQDGCVSTWPVNMTCHKMAVCQCDLSQDGCVSTWPVARWLCVSVICRKMVVCQCDLLLDGCVSVWPVARWLCVSR